MEIKSPGIHDADAIADQWVVLAHEQHAHGSDLLAAENRAAIRETIVRAIVTGGVLVARAEENAASGEPADEEGIVGFVTFGPETGNFERETDRGVVRNLHVVPGHRNAGVGSALLSAAEDALAAEGLGIVAIEAMADNEAARRFYRRHGYTPRRVELAKSLESDTH